MSEQLYVLKWNCHGQTLNQNLPAFLENDLLTDVTLSVGTRHVRAHKVILATCSVYFLQLFQEMQTTHPVVFLHSVTYDDVKAILSFMYKGQCIVSEEQLPNVLSVAKLLKIQGLCDMKIPIKQTRCETLTKKEESIFNSENQNPRDYSRNRTIPKEDKDAKLRNDDPILMYGFNYENPQDTEASDRSNTGPLSVSPPAALEPSSVPPSPPVPRDVQPGVCKCFLCGKYLSNQYNLRVHMETHQETYHACESCPHVSRSRDALRKHVSYRHPEEYHNRKRRKH